GAHGDDGLRRGRAVPDRLVHGLCASARERFARGHRHQPPGAGEDQRARRQGLRRGRVRRLAHLGHERDRPCAVRIRHPPPRHAGDAVPRLARHSGCAPCARGLIGPPPLRTTMAQAAELLIPTRVSETKLVAGVCFAHLVSHYYMLMLAPLFAFIRADFGVTYTELSLALTIFNVVSAVLQTPAGFFIDRTGARLNLIGGLLLGSAAIAIAGAVHSFLVFIAMFAVF